MVPWVDRLVVVFLAWAHSTINSEDSTSDDLTSFVDGNFCRPSARADIGRTRRGPLTPPAGARSLYYTSL